MGNRNMKASSTYRAILKEGRMEGRIEGAKRSLIMLGEHKGFGELSPHVRETIEAIHDFKQLEQLGIRLLYVNTWDELLAS